MYPAIRVDGLGKSYRLRHAAARAPYRTLRESLGELALAPLRRRRSRRSEGNGSGGRDWSEEFWALRDVCFEVEPGEVVGVIGRNGAGKSTLLKILSRITKPTSGRVEYRGRVGSLLEVGTGFHPELTGRENIYLNGSILGMSRREIAAKFDDIVAFSEVERFLDTPVKRYSSGMYVRLAFAVAAHLEPEILLVDEVLAVGDISFQNKCLAKMGEVARGGRTVLFVSHNMATVENLCGRALLLEGGELVGSGPSRQVVREYISRSRGAAERLFADRDGPGRFRFLGLRLENERGEATDTFSSGEQVTAAITLACSERIADVVLGLTLRTINETAVCNLRSEDRGVAYDLGPGTHEIRVSFRLENFLTNAFFVDLGAMAAGREVLGVIPKAAQIMVVSGDLSGYGRTRQKGEILYVPSTWERPGAPPPGGAAGGGHA